MNHTRNSLELRWIDDMKLLTAAEAARILQIEVATLTKWRSNGTGPAWHRIGGPEKGAIRYSESDLDDFIASSRMAGRS
jgi:hypothetical protein